MKKFENGVPSGERGASKAESEKAAELRKRIGEIAMYLAFAANGDPDVLEGIREVMQQALDQIPGAVNVETELEPDIEVIEPQVDKSGSGDGTDGASGGDGPDKKNDAPNGGDAGGEKGDDADKKGDGSDDVGDKKGDDTDEKDDDAGDKKDDGDDYEDGNKDKIEPLTAEMGYTKEQMADYVFNVAEKLREKGTLDPDSLIAMNIAVSGWGKLSHDDMLAVLKGREEDLSQTLALLRGRLSEYGIIQPSTDDGGDKNSDTPPVDKKDMPPVIGGEGGDDPSKSEDDDADKKDDGSDDSGNKIDEDSGDEGGDEADDGESGHEDGEIEPRMKPLAAWMHLDEQGMNDYMDALASRKARIYRDRGDKDMLKWSSDIAVAFQKLDYRGKQAVLTAPEDEFKISYPGLVDLRDDLVAFGFIEVSGSNSRAKNETKVDDSTEGDDDNSGAEAGDEKDDDDDDGAAEGDDPSTSGDSEGEDGAEEDDSDKVAEFINDDVYGYFLKEEWDLALKEWRGASYIESVDDLTPDDIQELKDKCDEIARGFAGLLEKSVDFRKWYLAGKRGDIDGISKLNYRELDELYDDYKRDTDGFRTKKDIDVITAEDMAAQSDDMARATMEVEYNKIKPLKLEVLERLNSAKVTWFNYDRNAWVYVLQGNTDKYEELVEAAKVLEEFGLVKIEKKAEDGDASAEAAAGAAEGENETLRQLIDAFKKSESKMAWLDEQPGAADGMIGHLGSGDELDPLREIGDINEANKKYEEDRRALAMSLSRDSSFASYYKDVKNGKLSDLTMMGWKKLKELQAEWENRSALAWD